VNTVIAAKAIEGHRLRLTFSDGSVRVFAATPYLKMGIFTELQDPNYFRDFKIAFGTVQWPNEQDFAPETLYLESEILDLKK